MAGKNEGARANEAAGAGNVDHAALLNALPTGVAQLTVGGTLHYANETAQTLLGSRDNLANALGNAWSRKPDVIEGGGARFAVQWLPNGDGTLAILRNATDETDAIAQAEREARCDALTELPNRKAFAEEATVALREASDLGTEVALLMVDLDGFKPVNDALGHGVGDALLRNVAKRLATAVRDTDSAYRLGGDEFALLLPCPDPSFGDARWVSEAAAGRIIDLVSRPFLVEGQMVSVGASVGIAISEDGADAEELLRRADLSLYRAKDEGRGRHAFYRPGMDREMMERREREIALRRAITLERMELHYQPQFDLSEGLVTGFEALVRWRREDGTLVPPNDFIPLAEETGLIVPLGEWVLREACREAATWSSSVLVSVNVSAVQFEADLCSMVQEALMASGLAAERLVIEITESVLADSTNVVTSLHALREMGVRIAMDDFGTGNSSLAYLRSHPFDIVKVDQSFVRGAGDDERKSAIIRSVTQLAETIGMTVTAEGVETVGQLENVRADGCGSVQGFLVGRPIPSTDLSGFFEHAAEAFASSGATPSNTNRRVATEASDGEDGATVTTLAPPAPARDDEPIHRLVYQSVGKTYDSATDERQEIRRILETAQRRNGENGVTGALMFNGTHFAQVLEGRREVLEETFERIQMDPRHQDVVLLSFAEAETRLFPEWKMAHIGPATARIAELSGLTGFDRAALRGDDVASRLHDILARSSMVA